MFKKSFSSAILLSAVCVLSFSLASALFNILLPYLLTGELTSVVSNPESLSQPGNLLALVEVVAFLELILIALGAVWLYRFFGEAYFGKFSVLRWALFGLLAALLLKIPDWLLPVAWWPLSYALKILAIFAAFFLARKLVPLQKPA